MPASRVEIIPATPRDVSYVAANMCEEDRREIACQFPAGTRPEDIAAICLTPGSEAWIATVDGQPVQAFGVIPATVSVLTAWAFGTPARWPAVPEMTRFVWAMFDRHVLAGVTRIEARAIVGHDAAHRWMRRMGAAETTLPQWGKNGEDFVLFSWTRHEWAGERGYRAVRKRFAGRGDAEWFDKWAAERCG